MDERQRKEGEKSDIAVAVVVVISFFCGKPPTTINSNDYWLSSRLQSMSIAWRILYTRPSSTLNTASSANTKMCIQKTAISGCIPFYMEYTFAGAKSENKRAKIGARALNFFVFNNFRLVVGGRDVGDGGFVCMNENGIDVLDGFPC